MLFRSHSGVFPRFTSDDKLFGLVKNFHEIRPLHLANWSAHSNLSPKSNSWLGKPTLLVFTKSLSKVLFRLKECKYFTVRSRWKNLTWNFSSKLSFMKVNVHVDWVIQSRWQIFAGNVASFIHSTSFVWFPRSLNWVRWGKYVSICISISIGKYPWFHEEQKNTVQ